MKTFIQIISAALVGAALVGNAWAGASKDEVVAQVNAAVAHFKKVGSEQAIKDLNSDPAWKAYSMNIVVNDMKGLVLASSLNEKLRGKNTWEIKDPAGKEFVKEFTSTAQKGEGWIDYQFINPETKKLEERSMFVKRIQGFEGFAGAAITK